MIYLVPNGFPVSVTDRFGSRTYPRERNERVAVHAVEMPHNGVLGAADAVGRAPSLAADGRERRLHLVHDASLVGNRHVVYAVELARLTAIERFVGGASSDDRAVHESELIRIHKTALPLLESANVATHWEKRCEITAFCKNKGGHWYLYSQSPPH